MTQTGNECKMSKRLRRGKRPHWRSIKQWGIITKLRAGELGNKIRDMFTFNIKTDLTILQNIAVQLL
jgi:hypothetical protein